MDYYDFIVVFFFNDTATTEIYTLSLHDALPIFGDVLRPLLVVLDRVDGEADDLHAALVELRLDRGHVAELRGADRGEDRKSTRLNSSHANISYAVFCLKKKTTIDCR